MRRIFWLQVFMVFILCIVGSLPSFGASKLPRIAVMEFETRGNLDDKQTGFIVSDWMSVALAETGEYEVYERLLTNRLLDEIANAQSGLVDEKTAAKVGKFVGAEYVVIGTISKMGQSILVTCRMVGVESSKVQRTARLSTTSIDTLPDLLAQMAKNLKENEKTEALIIKQDPTRIVSDAIQGVWKGAYRYDDPKRGQIMGNFEISIVEAGSDEFKGRIKEPRTDFGPNEPFLYSSILGKRRADGTIAFFKTYDYDGHVVEYYGNVLDRGQAIVGRWKIGEYTGSWHAKREN